MKRVRPASWCFLGIWLLIMIGLLVEYWADAAWWKVALWIVLVPVGVALALVIPAEESERE